MLPSIAESFRKDEIAACEAFLKGANRLKCPPHLTVDQWVDRTLQMHSHLIVRWGGLEYWGNAQQVVDRGAAENAVATLASKLALQIQVLYENAPYAGGYEPNGLPANFQPAWYMSVGSGTKYGYKAFTQKNIPEGMEGGPVWKKSDEIIITLGHYTERNGTYDKLGQYISPSPQKTLKGSCRVGERISSSVLRILEEHEFDSRYPKIYKLYEQTLQKFGEEVWVGQTKTTVVGFSVRPSIFLRLGHLCEGSSCYCNGGQSDHSKLFLGADMPDSFVALAHRDRDGYKIQDAIKLVGDKSYKPAARGWGVAAVSQGLFITNFYGLTLQSLWDAIKAELPKAFDIEDPTRYNAVMSKQNASQALGPLISVGQMYFNSDGFYVGGNTEFRQRMASRHLENVSRYAATYGSYTRLGQGPLEAQSDCPMPEEWPYKDLNLRELSRGSKSWL